MTEQIIRPFVSTLQPGAYSAIDASAVRQNPALASPVVAILGTCAGGAPNTPMFFRGPSALKSVARSGVAYDCARFAFGAGAGEVCLVRVAGTGCARGTLALTGASGTVVTLTALDYGAWTNSISVTVAANNVITLAYTDAFGVTTTEKYDLGASATAADIAAAINGTKYGYPKSNLVSAVAGAGTMPAAVISATPLASGNDGSAPAAGDWTSALTALEAQDVDILVPATGDASVHAQVKTHCENMSTPAARHERVAVVGGVAGESVATVSARVTSLRSSRVQLVYPGVTDYSDAGVLTSYDPFYAAAKIAGMHAALPDPAYALTHREFPTVDVEAKLSSVVGGSIDLLLGAGLTPIAPRPGGGYWVVDSLATYNTDDVFRDIHKVRSADYVAKLARGNLEAQFVGAKNLVGSQQTIAAAATSLLRDLVDQEVIRAYQAPVVTQGASATAYNVSLPVMLVDTTKFIYIMLALQPSSTLNRALGYSGANANA